MSREKITKEEAIQLASMFNYLSDKELFPNFAASQIIFNGQECTIVFAQHKDGASTDNPIDRNLDIAQGYGPSLTAAMVDISSKIRKV